MLRLPRNSQSSVPVANSARPGSRSAAPATKSALRGSPSAAPATKSALRGSPSAAPATKSALQGLPSAVPATKSVLRGSPNAVPATKSANEPHVQKSRLTAPVTKSELLDDHHHVQSAAPQPTTADKATTRPSNGARSFAIPNKTAPATKTAFRSNSPPIPCTCHEKSTSEHQTTRFPLRLPRKLTAVYQNAHGATTRARSVEAPAAGPQILRACAVEVHMDDVERHECTVNSNELAVHGRAPQRSKPQLLFYYRKNP